MGNMTLYNIKVQPFVKRAKGDWGAELHCLNHETQLMRENVVPYAASLMFIVGILLTVGAYGIYRQFLCKPKDTAYGMYDENGGKQNLLLYTDADKSLHIAKML